MGSESPPRPICCFCFSSKKNDGTSSRGGYGVSGSNTEWGKNEKILSDLSTFSVEEQERRLKKALKEEERVSKEAEKVVRWVKQESARMDVSVIKTVISDDEGTIK